LKVKTQRERFVPYYTMMICFTYAQLDRHLGLLFQILIHYPRRHLMKGLKGLNGVYLKTRRVFTVFHAVSRCPQMRALAI
jgi:hypothetical protein